MPGSTRHQYGQNTIDGPGWMGYLHHHHDYSSNFKNYIYVSDKCADEISPNVVSIKCFVLTVCTCVETPVLKVTNDFLHLPNPLQTVSQVRLTLPSLAAPNTPERITTRSRQCGISPTRERADGRSSCVPTGISPNSRLLEKSTWFCWVVTVLYL